MPAVHSEMGPNKKMDWQIERGLDRQIDSKQRHAQEKVKDSCEYQTIRGLRQRIQLFGVWRFFIVK